MEGDNVNVAANTPDAALDDASKDTIESGEREERIRNLTKALNKSKKEVYDAVENTKEQIGLLIAICIIVICFGMFFGWKLFQNQDKAPSDWRLIYFIFNRAVLVSTAFFIATYCFKLLKSYLHIYQRNSHRLLVINSMASLVGSASDKERDKIYCQLLDIIISFDKTGIYSEEDENIKLDSKIVNELVLKAIDKLGTQG